MKPQGGEGELGGSTKACEYIDYLQGTIRVTLSDWQMVIDVRQGRQRIRPRVHELQEWLELRICGGDTEGKSECRGAMDGAELGRGEIRAEG